MRSQADRQADDDAYERFKRNDGWMRHNTARCHAEELQGQLARGER